MDAGVGDGGRNGDISEQEIKDNVYIRPNLKSVLRKIESF